MKHVKTMWILMYLYSSVITAGDITEPAMPLSGPIAAHVLEEASPAFLNQLLAQLDQTESVVRQFAQETPKDKERRKSLTQIKEKLIKNDLGPQEFKQLMRELSKITKHIHARIREADTDREIEDTNQAFTQESLKMMIEQVQNSEEYMAFLLETQMPKQKERQQFWEETTKLLDDQPLEDSKLVDLIEKTTEHLELLASSLAICAKSFPPDPTKADYLKLPKRKSKPGC